MSDLHDKRCATVQAKGIMAWLDGLSRDDNPYTVSTQLGKKWAKLWLQGYARAENGLVCDTCDKWLSKKIGMHLEYSNGFNYCFCNKCIKLETRYAIRETV